MGKSIKDDASLYVVLWEFHVRSGRESEFEQVYGPEGQWAAFFRKSIDYVGTELFRDVEHKGRYVIMDVWHSQVAHDAFRQRWVDEYKALDKVFSSLTERDHRLGSFQTIGWSKFLSLLKTDEAEPS